MSVALQSPRSRMPFADTDLDLAALGGTLWRKKWFVLRPTILVALITLIAIQVITPRYQSESRVFIEGRDNVYLRPDAEKITTDPTIDQEAVTSQAQIILSRDLAREVIDKLKLGERPEFDPTLTGVSPIKAVLGLLGFVKDPLSMTPEERVLEAYYDRLNVVPVEKSRIINIDFLSEDPELAARVANAIADGYLVRQREAMQEQARSAGEWLSGEIDTMRKKVEDAEAKAEDFRSKTNLLIGTNNTTLSAQQLGELNAQLTVARGQKADAEAKAKMIREMLRSGQSIESSDILNSELIRRLAEQRVTLRAQLAEQSATLLDGHPRIKELKAQIADLDTQLRAEADTVARSLENDAKLAGSRVDTLTASLDQLKVQAATTNGQDVQLRALEREAKAQRDLLESYLAKYREATARDTPNSSPADARVISRATVSNVPAYPKKLPTLLIATFAALLLSSGLLLTREILAAPVMFTPARIEPDVPIADGLAPRVASIVNETRYGELRSAAGVSVNAAADLAHNLRNAGVGSPRIAVLGATPGMNTSQPAIKLARTLAEEFRVVLVGLASGDSAIRAISSEPSASGLADLAGGTASFRDIITKDRLSPLHLVTSGRAQSDRLALLSAPAMATNFDALARSYDYVVIDAGESAGPAVERICEIAPNAVLVAEAPASVATAAARERLLAAGFNDVIVLQGTRPSTETAAAA
jgi:succinoglycan biosynthesis transport protein ExoP